MFVPRNIAHTLANHSDAEARYLLVCTLAGFERHWGRIAAAQGVEPPDWALQPIPEVITVGPQIARGDGWTYAERAIDQLLNCTGASASEPLPHRRQRSATAQPRR